MTGQDSGRFLANHVRLNAGRPNWLGLGQGRVEAEDEIGGGGI